MSTPESEKKRGNKMATLFASRLMQKEPVSPKASLASKMTMDFCEKPLEKKRLYTIEGVEKLLKKKKYKGLLEQCVYLLEFTSIQKKHYFDPLVKNFSEFVQLLPETNHSYFSDEGGFIAHALTRTTSALSMCRAYFLADKPEVSQSELNANEKLLMYTLFSACLFCGIGRIFSDFVIELYDEHGMHRDRWNPFEGSMNKAKYHFYDYEFEDSIHSDLFNGRLSVLFAKDLMPVRGFSWISSDKEALSIWLALLEENTRDSGTLGPFLARADALAIKDYFDERRLQRNYSDLDPRARELIDKLSKDKKEASEKVKDWRDTDERAFFKRLEATEASSKTSERTVSEHQGFSDSDVDKAILNNGGTAAGVAFMQWLGKELAKRSLMFNQVIFYLEAGAIFLPTTLFESFKKLHPNYKNTQDIINSFNKLELSLKTADKNMMHTFLTPDGAKMNGVVLKNPSLILGNKISLNSNGQIYTIASDKIQNHLHLVTPLQPMAPEALEKLSINSRNNLMFGL